MLKKSILIIILFVVSSTMSFGQEHETILTSPDNWQNEIIPFPLGFAPTIDFVGFKDLRFSPGWNDSDSEEFWTYCFVWYIEKDAAMTENTLTEYFNLYYDGLMETDVKNQAGSRNSNQLEKTLSLFVKTNDGFAGKMRTYDRFFTKDYITLNIKVKESFCPETNKQIILCDISPKPFNNEVWEIFNDVRLKLKCD